MFRLGIHLWSKAVEEVMVKEYPLFLYVETYSNSGFQTPNSK